MCQHPTHQVNVSRKGVLCAVDSSKFFETPCIVSKAIKPIVYIELPYQIANQFDAFHSRYSVSTDTSVMLMW